jgi:hypothetical protein
MIHARHLLLIAAAAGCSDYQFVPSDGVDDKLDDSTWVPGDSDTTTDDICEDPGRSQGTVSIDEACNIEAETGTFTPTLEWASSAPGDTYTTPVIGNLTDDDGDGDIDDDDIPDIVVANISGTMFALSGDGGRVHWSYAMGGNEPATAAIGDLDGDGVPEVVGASNTGIFALRADGSRYWSATPSGFGYIPTCGGVGIYDLDADGYPEVIMGNIFLDGRSGSIVGRGSHGAGSGYGNGFGSTVAAFGVAADIDRDGVQEVVTGNALYRKDGSAIWYNSRPDGFVAVANFDSDPEGEIVSTYTGNVALIDDDGTTLWFGNYTGSTIGPPTVADFDGDGLPEIGVAGHGAYVVIEHDGTLKWSNTTNDYSSGFTGSSVFDFEGDGAAEVVYADENDVWVYDGATGRVKMQESRHSSATCSEYPAIADVDNDGQAEIIYASGAYSGSETGVRVIGDADGSWMAGRTVWNQHAYHITNVGARGSIPAVPDANWLSYNSFRSGDLSAAAGGAYSDALPEHVEICLDDCDQGLLQVVVRVGNGGVDDMPSSVPVSLYSLQGSQATFIESQDTVQVVPAGETTYGMVYTIDASEVPSGRLRVVVDDDNGLQTLQECHEDNNIWETEDAACP